MSKSTSGWGIVPKDLVLSDFNTAKAATLTINPGIYNVDLKRDWCVGTVPQGGYLMAILTSTTSKYIEDEFSELDQPDMITANFEFLGRSVIGAAQVKCKIIKRGRQFSTFRVRLIQGTTKDGKPATTMEAIISQGNLAKEENNNLKNLVTQFRMSGDALKKEDAEAWSDKLKGHRPVLSKIEILTTRNANANRHGEILPNPSIKEQWVRWSPQVYKGFDVTGLAFMCDSWRPLPEQYGLTGNWYPTLNARIEVKRQPPPGGWEWLYMRIEMKVIRNGRFDYEAIIFDEEGQVVALSHHTALIVGAERNAKVKEVKL